MRNHSQFQSLIKEELVSVVDLHAVDTLVDLAQPKTAVAAEVVAVPYYLDVPDVRHSLSALTHHGQRHACGARRR